MSIYKKPGFLQNRPVSYIHRGVDVVDMTIIACFPVAINMAKRKYLSVVLKIQLKKDISMPKFSRRNVLKSTVGAVVLFGGGYAAFKLLNKPPVLDLVRLQSLPIPPLLNSTEIDGRKVFDLTIQKGVSTFVVGTEAETFGYNGNNLGPSLVMNKGDDVVLNVTNNLGEPSSVHWHGLHLPAKMDGGPHQLIDHGDTWRAEFTILNEATTFFYHSHMMHKTGEQVYRGLTGLFIVKDPENEPKLPDQYGIDDIPLIVQDRSFDESGALVYDGKIEGEKGDFILVNGAINPTFQAPAQLVRFRVLNGANARLFNFGFSDNRQFFQVGTDGGLLEKPVAMTRLLLSPAERAEIIVDFSGKESESVKLVSYSDEVSGIAPFWAKDSLDKQVFDVLDITVVPPTENAVTSLPDSLATLVRLNENKASVTRKFVLGMSMMRGNMTINGETMDIDRIDHTVKLDDIEIWEISNPTEMMHPFHIHDIQFQILTRDGQPPAENESGWKDTVLVKQNETVRVIAHFTEFADPDSPYMFHCHILEHEDAGMMGQFVVV